MLFRSPGYGENSRVLKWVFERVAGEADAVETAIGYLPAAGGIDTDGLDVSADDMATLLSVDVDGWKGALPQMRAHFAQFGEALPSQLAAQLDKLAAAL